MKKSLLVLGVALLTSTSVFASNWGYAQNPSYGTYQQPAAQSAPVRKRAPETTYRMGNPLYHPTKGQKLFTAGSSYQYIPKEDAIRQPKVMGWTLDPEGEVGLTDKLSVYLNGGYGRFEVKSGPTKGRKVSEYAAAAGVRYLLASADGFDFNVDAGLYYDKSRAKDFGTTARRTGTDIGFQVGKKIMNMTPYFGVGFQTDFWSKRGSSHGTDTYINPGIYIDLTKVMSLNIDYKSVVHDDARYGATLDVYPNRRFMLSFGSFVEHPETDKDRYGLTGAIKVAF